MTTLDHRRVQTTLLPPAAVSLTLRVGVVPSAGHAQLQWAITSATDGELLAMESTPHLEAGNLPPAATKALQDALRALWELTGPF